MQGGISRPMHCFVAWHWQGQRIRYTDRAVFQDRSWRRRASSLLDQRRRQRHCRRTSLNQRPCPPVSSLPLGHTTRTLHHLDINNQTKHHMPLKIVTISTTTLQPFNGLFSRTTWVSRYQKGKTSQDFNEATDDGVWGCSSITWTICTSSLNFYRPDATPEALTAL